ncbi:hypothetical protein Bca52824_065825 [Brassica carinata]|uniref:Uncharacterized protein n=1 Tax=Brassica carinata TaxID=52824 RepID=A0A8X7QMR7_BRACI|nr:hypothetical protein Bca52824_065825 [Brassica carinata]
MKWRELGIGLLGQVIVLLALQLVPLNQLQRAGLELDKVFRLFIMGKRYEERMRGSGIVALEWRIAVQRHDGVKVRRNWMVTWCNKDLSDYGISLYYISKVECNYSGKVTDWWGRILSTEICKAFNVLLVYRKGF